MNQETNMESIELSIQAFIPCEKNIEFTLGNILMLTEQIGFKASKEKGIQKLLFKNGKISEILA